MSVKQQMAF